MYIFFYISIIIFIIGIIFFIIGVRKQGQKLEELENNKRNYLEEQLQGIIKQCDQAEHERQQLILKRDATAHERMIETERLEELKNHSRQILLTEKERLESEINAIRTVKMQQLNNEFAARSELLEEQFAEKQTKINTELAECENTLQQFKNIQAAVNEAVRRKKEIEENEIFYSIDVSETDQEDIAILQSMDARLHNRDVIPKLIWELFIRRPAQEMIKRVVGTEKVSGIYKITYKKTGEAYIGKTTDFSTRWQNHIKTAIGLEGAARSTLHNRMAKDGLWNYTFEILEEVDKDHLSAREAYYIDLYGTKTQLNMKEGSKNGTQ